MTKHKQQKSRKRTKVKQKEIRAHRDSYRVRHPDESLAHPKPLSKEKILAMRKPVPEEPPTGAPVPSKPGKPPADEEVVEEPVPVGASEEGGKRE